MAHILTNPIKAVDSVKAQYNSYANDLSRSLPRNIGVHHLRAVCHWIYRCLFLAICCLQMQRERYSILPDTRRESGVFFSPVILFLDCGETQEASYVKSKFKIFKTGLPGQLESVSTEERSLSVYTRHTPVGFLGV